MGGFSDKEEGKAGGVSVDGKLAEAEEAFDDREDTWRGIGEELGG